MIDFSSIPWTGSVNYINRSFVRWNQDGTQLIAAIHGHPLAVFRSEDWQPHLKLVGGRASSQYDAAFNPNHSGSLSCTRMRFAFTIRTRRA